MTEEEFRALPSSEAQRAHLIALQEAGDEAARWDLLPIWASRRDREEREREEAWIEATFTTPEAKAIYYGAKHIAEHIGEVIGDKLEAGRGAD